ncbi:MAG: hypothetical protein ACYTG1_03400 [Planctomycetota bacterium]|jgi:hypothetical protein
MYSTEPRATRPGRTPRPIPAGLLAVLAAVLVAAGPARGQSYKELLFVNNWNGGEQIRVSAGGDSFTHTVPAGGGTAVECAQAFAASATAPFTIQMATNNPAGLRICHATEVPKVEKRGIKNFRLRGNSFYTDPSPALASTNLIEVRGAATGGGEVTLIVEDINVSTLTFPGQTPEEIVDLLMAELDAATPDDVDHSFGAEFTVAAFGAGPIDSADIGIWKLGSRDLDTTIFFSTDPGIILEQEPIDTFTCPWYEDFEPYLPGGGLHGQGGWKGWDDDPAFDAPATSAQARSPAKAVDIAGDADLVAERCAFGGTWSFEAWQYIPLDFDSLGGGQFAGTNFLLLNTYQDGGPYNWSVWCQFDSNDGMLKVYHGDGNNTINVPYDSDRWVKIQAVIDLEEDWTRVYYDDELVSEYVWTGGVIGDPTTT